MTPTRLTPEQEQHLRRWITDPPNSLTEPIRNALAELDAMRADLAHVTAERDAALARGRELVEMHDEQIARAEQAEARERALREALDSIANSSCCGSCQEAARVAKKALAATREEPTT